MWRWLIIALCCGAVTGCSRSHSATRRACDYAPRANLALGSSPQLVSAAVSGFPRSDWPAAVHGYRFDEMTVYSSSLYDQQIQFDDYNGLIYETQTVRSGTWSP